MYMYIIKSIKLHRDHFLIPCSYLTANAKMASGCELLILKKYSQVILIKYIIMVD